MGEKWERGRGGMTVEKEDRRKETNEWRRRTRRQRSKEREEVWKEGDEGKK